MVLLMVDSFGGCGCYFAGAGLFRRAVIYGELFRDFRR